MEILGVPVDNVTAVESVARITEILQSGRSAHVVTVNPEFVMAARRDPEFLAVLRAAELSLADGVGMVWASRLLGQRLPERVAGVDILPRIAQAAAGLGKSVFLLGAAPGVADRAATSLALVAGVHSGSPSDSEADSIVRLVNRSGAAVLFVAFGAPAQDMWIARHRDALHVQVMMGVGGAFDFLAGERRRAPEPLRRVGMEWLWRLAAEPWRWRRQLALPRFAAAVAVQAVKRRH